VGTAGSLEPRDFGRWLLGRRLDLLVVYVVVRLEGDGSGQMVRGMGNGHCEKEIGGRTNEWKNSND
jgi:hypothetical protein